MNLKDIGEFGLIRRLSRGCLVRPEGIFRGIGDDAAAIRTDGTALTLVTTDMMVDQVHFLRERMPGEILGHKVLAVNLSDIAAMGGTAREAFVSMAVPAGCPVSYLEEVYEGMKRLAARHCVNILGGDTTGSPSVLFLGITVIGAVASTEILRRDTARAGDVLLVTDPLGDSRAGLMKILGQEGPIDPSGDPLLTAHCLPEPRLAEGRFFAAGGRVTACMDVSDGLASDIRRIAEESRLGARIHEAILPVSEPLKSFCGQRGLRPAAFALSGGEDYALLCTARAADAPRLASEFIARFGRPLFRIGEMTTGSHVELVDAEGGVSPLPESGWDHFRKDETHAG